jgi:flagellar biosynthesis/type III secretory pathway protein FliH
VLDWMMRLPDALEQKLWKDIEEIEGETRMPYVTSVERLAKQRGMEEGLQQGIQQGTERGERIGEAKVVERQLARRFGPLAAETRARLQAATLEQLDRWADRLLDAATLEEVFSDS